jgi:hypothetical protein
MVSLSHMSRLTPLAALAMCWFIGIVFGKPGIWFPIGLVALVAVALVQKRQEPRA